MLGVFWSVVTFPFRLLGTLIDFLGRTALIVVGFGVMVAGAMLLPWTRVVGVPLFIVGLLITLRGLN